MAKTATPAYRGTECGWTNAKWVGRCGECQYNDWGTGKKGRGKACQKHRWIYLLSGDAMLPTVFVASVMSAGKFKDYMLRLGMKAMKLAHQVWTQIGLLQTKNTDGIPYSQMTFKCIGNLDKESQAKVDAYREAVIPLLSRDNG